VIGILAVGDFAYQASVFAYCHPVEYTDSLGHKYAASRPKFCDTPSAALDDRQQLDAIGIVIAVGLLAGSVAMSRRLNRHRR
jgi:hypothetical protein